MARGIAAMIAACVIWGLSPLFYRLLSDIPPLEVLCYRSLYSLAFFAVILAAGGRLRGVLSALRSPRTLGIVAASGLMISLNWLGFIYSISIGNGLQASLGYYIFPLVSVVLGRIVFGERLTRAQWVAVALAGLAVAVLTAGLGVPPWIALSLALTFGAYGVLKKGLPMGAIQSVTAEVFLIAPLAVAWLAARHTTLDGDTSLQTHALLAISGPLTGLPLILFSYAARRVRLSTLGLVQYLNPTLQFVCAVVVFANPITAAHAVAFPLIWAGLALYSISAMRQDRARRRASSMMERAGPPAV